MSSSVAARSGARTDGVRWVAGVVRGLARRRFRSVRTVCGLTLPGLLAMGTIEACAQSPSVYQSVFPTETRLGSLCSASGGVFNTSTGTFYNVIVTLTASPSGKFKNLMAYPPSVTYTSMAPNHVIFNMGDLTAFQSTSLGYDFVPDQCTSYNLDLVAMASNSVPVTNTVVVVINEPYSRYFLAGVQLPAVEEPVSGFSGKEVFTEAADFNLGGPGLPIFFRRHYDGGLFEDGVINSALGPNWQHNYDITLNVSGTNATVGFRQGRILHFENDGANWNLTERRDIPFRLVESGADFILGDPRSQIMYFFNASGLLTRIEDGKGNTNFLSYNGVLLTNVNDGLNRQLTLQYDGGGQLTNVSDGVRSVGFTHGSPLASAVDALGFITSYSYTTNTNNPALLTARTLPEGNTPFTQFYNAQGRVSAQTDGAGNTTTFGYGPATGGRQTSVTNPLGDVRVQFYTADGEFSQFTDEAGKSIYVQQEFNTGRRSSVRDRHNILTRIFYEATNGLPNRIDLAGTHPDEAFAYSPRVVNGFAFFDLFRTIHPDGTTNLFGHDAQGNLTGQTNRVGDVWLYGRNSRGQLLSITNPLGGTASFAYDASFRLVSSTDSDVGVTSYEYDAFNRLTNLTHPNPTSVQFTYDALDRLTSVTDERSNTTAFEYDGNSRLTNIVDALGQGTRYEYDAADRFVREVDRLGHPTSFGYDPRSLLSSVTNRNGFVTRLVYDSRQRLTGLVNPAGVTNFLGYDDEGLIISITNALGETLRFQRDPMGYVTNLIDPFNNRILLTLDSMKRVTGITDALNRQSGFNYDRRGLLTNVTQEAGISATYRYNPLGLLTNLTDAKGSQWIYAYTSVGRPTNFADPLGRQTSFAYDVRGRRSQTTFADGVTRTNTYDGANNVIQMAWSDGTLFQFAYDPLNRLTNAAGSDPIAFSYDAEDRVTNTRQVGLDFVASYDADGRLSSVSYSNGLFTVTYEHDSRDRLIHVSDNLTGQGMGFGYDDAGRLTGVIRSNGVNGTYTHDARGFLTRIQEGSILDLQYTGDAAGQVTEADYVVVPIDPASVLTNEQATFTYDAASQLSSAGYQYDPRGRLTNAPNTSFLWDGASRLMGIDAVNLGYNALGDLATRAEGGNANRYFYNYAIGLHPIMAERDDNTGQFVRFYVWSPDGLLLYIINLPDNTVSYPLFDYTRSTLALTDIGGAVTDAYAYDPYGRLLAQTGTNAQPFLFVGQTGVRHEPAAGLYQMRARYYDPKSGRFLSREPLWPMLRNPKKLNPYQYAQQDPVRLIDRTGTTEEPARPMWTDYHDDDLYERNPRPDLSDEEKANANLIYDWMRWEKYTKKNRRFTERSARRLEDKILLKYEKAKDTSPNRRNTAKQYQQTIDEWLENARKWDSWMRSQLPQMGSEIGPSVPPGGAVPPSPGTDPTPPETPEDAGTDEEYGFLFGGDAGGVPVSYSPPDDFYPTPRSDCVYNQIWNGNGCLNYSTQDLFSRPGYNGMSGGFDDSWGFPNDGFPIRNPETGMMEWVRDLIR